MTRLSNALGGGGLRKYVVRQLGVTITMLIKTTPPGRARSHEINAMETMQVLTLGSESRQVHLIDPGDVLGEELLDPALSSASCSS
jgi:hypothetical protein